MQDEILAPFSNQVNTYFLRNIASPVRSCFRRCLHQNLNRSRCLQTEDDNQMDIVAEDTNRMDIVKEVHPEGVHSDEMDETDVDQDHEEVGESDNEEDSDDFTIKTDQDMQMKFVISVHSLTILTCLDTGKIYDYTARIE